MDELYMRRCFELARNGEGRVAPNPLVGAVIVHNRRVIGEGYHTQYGKPHAEVEAVNSVHETDLLPESTLYVNLEPCSHYGKTPPCCELIVQKRIPRVVIAAGDPFPEVSGRGIKYLKDHGIDVTVGVLENEARKLNRFFYTYYEQKRPFISLKWAESPDRFIDRIRDVSDPPTVISNSVSHMLVHRWRMQMQAIMVGTNTAIMDNPHLTVRRWYGNNPVRIVPDKLQRIPLTSNLFNNEAKTLLFTGKDTMKNSTYPANVEVLPVDFSDGIEQLILRELYNRKIQSVLIEGGSCLLNSFLEKGLWDDASVCVAQKMIGEGVKAPAHPAAYLENTVNLSGDTLFYYQRKK